MVKAAACKGDAGTQRGRHTLSTAPGQDQQKKKAPKGQTEREIKPGGGREPRGALGGCGEAAPRPPRAVPAPGGAAQASPGPRAGLGPGRAGPRRRRPRALT